MKAGFVLLLWGLTLASAGGNYIREPVLAPIEQFPSTAAILRSFLDSAYIVHCSGTILNNRSILTSAFCVYLDKDQTNRLRFRVGSASWNSGGVVYDVTQVLLHDSWDEWDMGGDVAVVRTSTGIAYDSNIQPGVFAGPNYNVPEGHVLTTVGWGYLSFPSILYPAVYEQLQQVKLRTIDRAYCRNYYVPWGVYPSNRAICTVAADEDAALRDSCFSGAGAPLYDNGVVVGIRAFSISCGESGGNLPSINTLVSEVIDWIASNA